jgi:membrane-bound lytic murein transglycosylase D
MNSDSRFNNFFAGLLWPGIIIFVVISVLFAFFKGKEINENAGIREESNMRFYPINLPENLDFAGEKVPVHYPDIKESIDRELQINTYWQSQTILTLKRSERMFAIIEPILKKHGIPNDFKYLAAIESGLTNVVSSADAKGIWQIMEGTGKELGLEVNDLVDERYHYEKSTEAACKFLRESYRKFGSWTLAAASYNCGRSRISKELDRQKVRSFYDLLLNDETARYIFRILAMKSIMKDPQQYGYYLDKQDYYPIMQSTEINIDSSVTDFIYIADKYDINYKILKIYNPWLRNNYLPNKVKKSYILKIPKNNFRPQAAAQKKP